MRKIKEPEKPQKSIWVNWEKEILSFHKAEGFEEVKFPNRKQMLTFAAEKSHKGFLIQ